MITIALIFAFAAYGIGPLLTLWRLPTGPAHAERILPLDTKVIHLIGLISPPGIWQGHPPHLDASTLLAMVGFVSTVAYCRFLLRGDIIE